MKILTTPHPRLHAGIRFRKARDIDKQARFRIDPSGVYHILSISSHAFNVVGVYVEEVAVRGGCRRVRVIVECHVKVLAQPCERRGTDLHIEIPVPGHDFPIPPPPQQSAVREERLDVFGAEDGEVGADEVEERLAALFVGDGRAGVVADVVVAELVVAAGFVEVFCGGGFFLVEG